MSTYQERVISRSQEGGVNGGLFQLCDSDSAAPGVGLDGLCGPF